MVSGAEEESEVTVPNESDMAWMMMCQGGSKEDSGARSMLRDGICVILLECGSNTLYGGWDTPELIDLD